MLGDVDLGNVPNGQESHAFSRGFQITSSCHVQVRRMAVTGVSWAAIEVLSCVKDEMCINTHTHKITLTITFCNVAQTRNLNIFELRSRNALQPAACECGKHSKSLFMMFCQHMSISFHIVGPPKLGRNLRHVFVHSTLQDEFKSCRIIFHRHCLLKCKLTLI